MALRRVPRSREAAVAVLLVCLVGSGCTALRPDRTEFEPKEEPTGSAIVPVGPRKAVAVERVSGTINGAPYQPIPETRRRLVQVLRDSKVFSHVHDENEPDPPPQDALQVAIDSSYAVDAHEVANFFRALLVGAIGYRVHIEGRLTFLFQGAPGEAPISHEVTTRATRIYYSSGRASQARAVLLAEVEDASRRQMITSLRSDPRLRVASPTP